tara:strand:+ start:394 stop:570 length:177 start_codon:yes stop_codon:yes gene_type:complete
MIGYYICPKCNGNGYINTSVKDSAEKVAIDCKECKNQGEIPLEDGVIGNDIKYSDMLQ